MEHENDPDIDEPYVPPAGNTLAPQKTEPVSYRNFWMYVLLMLLTLNFMETLLSLFRHPTQNVTFSFIFVCNQNKKQPLKLLKKWEMPNDLWQKKKGWNK